MDDACAVRRVERVADVDRGRNASAGDSGPRSQSLGERLALEILEHEKANCVVSEARWVWVRSVAEVVERADVWVIE